MSPKQDNQPTTDAGKDKKIVALQMEIEELQKRLSIVDKERVEYLQNVSHQLVAPLNAMKWHIENISNGRISTERAQKVFRSIYSQATLAVHLAKNFALMSNLDEDHSLNSLREPLQEVPLLALLINLADDFQPLAWDKNINISVVDKNLAKAPPVWAIKPLISQVFSNIIENAVKYSHNDTEIIIDGSYNQSDNTVSVRISNLGLSIKTDDLRKIFDRGYRAEGAKNKYPAGTGFGLYIAKRIVSIHEGKLRVGSNENGRTIFEVILTVDKLSGKTRHRDPKDSSAYR
jgi:signal transduction histidine kinase